EHREEAERAGRAGEEARLPAGGVETALERAQALEVVERTAEPAGEAERQGQRAAQWCETERNPARAAPIEPAHQVIDQRLARAVRRARRAEHVLDQPAAPRIDRHRDQERDRLAPALGQHEASLLG